MHGCVRMDSYIFVYDVVIKQTYVSKNRIRATPEDIERFLHVRNV